jgi:hypothetical protein
VKIARRRISMAHAKIVLKNPDPKKHSVKFDVEEGTKTPLITSIYIMREAAKKYLGVKDLDAVKAVEITVRIVD